jgi:hypothetical protein
MLHEETGLAHKLSRALRQNPTHPVARRLRLGDLLLVLLFLRRGNPVLENGVEIGLHVIGVVLLLVLRILVIVLGLDGLNGAVPVIVVVVQIAGFIVTVVEIAIVEITVVEITIVEITVVGRLDFPHLLEIVVFLEDFVVGHENPL